MLNPRNLTYDDIAERMRRYVASTETLLALVITGCYWGEAHHEGLWLKCIEMIADHTRLRRRVKVYLDLLDFPALMLMYGGGVAAVAAGKYGNLAAILVRASGTEASWNREIPLAYLLNSEVVIDPHVAQHIIEPGKRSYTPASSYLFQLLREPLKELIPRDAQYEQYFDRFEYLWTLIHVDLRSQFKSGARWVIGRYLWSDVKDNDFTKSVLTHLYEEMDTTDNWPGLQAGLFGGSKIRMTVARDTFNDALPRLLHN